MIVGHFWRISPKMTHDHESAVQGRRRPGGNGQAEGAQPVAYPRACNHDPNASALKTLAIQSLWSDNLGRGAVDAIFAVVPTEQERNRETR
jgi:hypothetical protein